MCQFLLFATERDVASDAIDRLVAADIDQPGAGIGRHAGVWPPRQRYRERILQCILGEIEIADEADQGRQRPARLVAKDFFDFDGSHEHSTLGSSFRDARALARANAEPRDSPMCNST